MIGYSVQPIDPTFVKGYGLSPFAKKWVEILAKV